MDGFAKREVGAYRWFRNGRFGRPDVIKVEDILDYSVKENIAERFAKRLGADVSQNLILRLFSTERVSVR